MEENKQPIQEPLVHEAASKEEKAVEET